MKINNCIKINSTKKNNKIKDAIKIENTFVSIESIAPEELKSVKLKNRGHSIFSKK